MPFCTNQSTAKGKKKLSVPSNFDDISVSNNEYRKPSLWAADRLRARDPQFQINDSLPEIYFTGEMVNSPTQSRIVSIKISNTNSYLLGLQGYVRVLLGTCRAQGSG